MNFPTKIVSEFGVQFWSVNGLHRTDGPAEIWADGSQCWYVNGNRHRLDGPARILADGSQEWYVNYNLITGELLLD